MERQTKDVGSVSYRNQSFSIVAGLDESGKTNLINQIFHFKHLLEQNSNNNQEIKAESAGTQTSQFKFSWPDSESVFDLLELPGSLL